jgi:DNA primase
MAFPPQFLDELRARVGIVEVIGKRLRLNRRGREHLGLCPFHKEKTPSFTVFDDHYHCFGCGAHGSAIDFVMAIEGIDFREAVERLAASVGMELPDERPQDRERIARRQGLYEVLEAAARHFEKTLRMPEGKAAAEYLGRRGLDDAAMQQFRIGFAPASSTALKAALAGEGFSEAAMQEAGLLVSPDEPGRPAYDRFRGRVMFPIADRRGRVVAFGGRALGSGEPKYLNSPETPLFQKGRMLYGAHLAVPAVRAAGTIIVVEGYMDVIGLSRAGFANTVAPLGTALTPEQIGELWRLAAAPVLLFDPDDAGYRAAARAAERALPILRPGYGLRFAFVRTDTGDDPDQVSRTYRPQFLRQALAEALSLSDLLYWMETRGRTVRSAEDRAGLEERLRRHAREITDPNLRSHFLRDFRERLWRDQRPRAGRSAQPAAVAMPASDDAPAGDAERLREAILLAVLLTHPESFEVIGERLGLLTFSDPELDIVRQEAVKTLALLQDLDSAGLESHLRQLGLGSTLDFLLGPRVLDHAFFAGRGVAVETAVQGWEEAFALYRRRDIRVELEEVRERLGKDLSPEGIRYFQALKQQELTATRSAAEPHRRGKSASEEA